MRLGIIARSDKTGLGNQTRELVEMLSPQKILLIDSSHFNKNKQFPEIYEGYAISTTSKGFASNQEVRDFLQDLDAVLSCETFYNVDFVSIAKEMGVKTLLQYNFEFLDYLKFPGRPLPDVLISPSLWNFEFVFNEFGKNCDVVHLPPPTSPDRFDLARRKNIKTENKRVLHLAGKIADADRNGTNTVIEMLKHSQAGYELVIKVQNPERLEKKSNDPRLKIDSTNPNNHADLYAGFDAMVLPRRYAGLCLPMNESLISGLPVFMTNISPNNSVLPKEWLIDSKKIGKIKTRRVLPVYEADPVSLAKKIDSFMNSNKEEEKEKAFAIGHKLFSPEGLREKYIQLIEAIVNS